MFQSIATCWCCVFCVAIIIDCACCWVPWVLLLQSVLTRSVGSAGRWRRASLRPATTCRTVEAAESVSRLYQTTAPAHRRRHDLLNQVVVAVRLSGDATLRWTVLARAPCCRNRRVMVELNLTQRRTALGQGLRAAPRRGSAAGQWQLAGRGRAYDARRPARDPGRRNRLAAAFGRV